MPQRNVVRETTRVWTRHALPKTTTRSLQSGCPGRKRTGTGLHILGEHLQRQLLTHIRIALTPRMSLTRAGRYARQPTSPVLGAKKVTENNSRENKSTNDVVTVGAWLRWQKKAAGNAAANEHTRQSLGTLTCFIMLSKLVSDENPGVPYDDFRLPAKAFRICMLPCVPCEGGRIKTTPDRSRC
jgi:hypothetical protein